MQTDVFSTSCWKALMQHVQETADDMPAPCSINTIQFMYQSSGAAWYWFWLSLVDASLVYHLHNCARVLLNTAPP